MNDEFVNNLLDYIASMIDLIDLQIDIEDANLERYPESVVIRESISRLESKLEICYELLDAIHTLSSEKE